MSLLNKISLIVLGGAVVGAILTGIVLYAVLILVGVESSKAFSTALFYTPIIGISFLIPVYMIRFLVDKLIISKVRHMSEVINRISKGDIDAKVDITSDDELGRMAEAFERMRRSLKHLMSRVKGGQGG